MTTTPNYDPIIDPPDVTELRDWSSDVVSGDNNQYEPDTQPLRSNSRRLGRPASKPVGNVSDLLLLLITLLSVAIAVAVVANQQLAWNLQFKKQIVVLGFLLSIMNGCMVSVLPMVLLQLDAQFGQFTLQNCEAVLRWTPLSSQVDWWLRTTLVLIFALPLGLSAAYKTFIGGSSSLRITSSNNNLYTDTFGVYAPPGILPLGDNGGPILFINATIPFLTASTNTSKIYARDPLYGNPRYDPSLPEHPQAYGFNTLLLREDMSALLDTPSADWIDEVQPTLQLGETWNITASVLGTVAQINTTIDAYRSPSSDESGFWQFWHSHAAPNDIRTRELYNGNMFVFLYQIDFGNATTYDQSWCFLGFISDSDMSDDNKLIDFAKNAIMLNISRQNCTGTWSITAGAVKLLDGYCDAAKDITVAEKSQEILTDSVLDLHDMFMDSLVELLSPYRTYRNASKWLSPTMATVAASMYWSRVAAAFGPQSPHWAGNDTVISRKDHVRTSAGMNYTSPSHILSSRPSIKRSPWLYLVLGIQSIITIALLAARSTMYNIPIGKGFGLIALLAGVKPDTSVLLNGAAFSGQLDKPVHVNIAIDKTDDTLTYSLDDSNIDSSSKSTIQRRHVYG